MEVKTLIFALPLAIENLPGVRILMSKPRHFPCTAGTLENCPALWPRYPPSFPVGVCGGGGGLLQMTGALRTITIIPLLAVEETAVTGITRPLCRFPVRSFGLLGRFSVGSFGLCVIWFSIGSFGLCVIWLSVGSFGLCGRFCSDGL